MNGAVQGEATATASTPVSAVVGDRVARTQRRQAARQQRARTRTRPSRFRPISANSTASAGDEHRRLQLEAPAELVAARAQRQQQAGERDERQHDAGGVGQALASDAARRCRARPAKPSTLSDSTGNTHGIRFSSRPPMSANASDSSSGTGLPPAGRGAGIGAARSSARPPPAAPLRAPAVEASPAPRTRPATPRGSPGSASTACSRDGLSLRCGDSGTRNASRSPSQRCSMRRGVVDHAGVGSAKKSSALPRRSAGRPSICSASDLARRPSPARSPPTPAAAARHGACGERVGVGGGARSAPAWRARTRPTAGCRRPCRPASRRRSWTSSAAPRKSAGTRDRHRQQQRAFVAVVDQRTDRQPLRRRPLDLAGLEAGRQVPVERRRQPESPGFFQ